MIALLRSGRHLSVKDQLAVADKLERLKRIVRNHPPQEPVDDERKALETAAAALA